MSEPLTNYLRCLDVTTLERLAGTTIVRAVQCAFDTNRESELARLVCDRYGVSALENRALRDELLSSLPKAKSVSFCMALRIKLAEGDIPQAKLVKYFSGPFTSEKSRELVDLLGLHGSYVRKTVVDTRAASEDLLSPSRNGITRARGFLHSYQIRIKDQVVSKVEKSDRRMMVQMPTGSGKTATALEIVVDLFRLPSQRKFVVWLVNSAELAEQAFETFKSLWIQKGDRSLTAHRMFGEFSLEFSAINGGFVVATFDKLRQPLSDPSHKSHSNVWHLIRRTDLLIVDEAHTSTAETYEEIIRRFLTGGDPILIGLTATPARNDIESTAELTQLYSGNLVSLQDDVGQTIPDAIGYLQEQGFLANLELKELESGVSCGEREEKGLCNVLAESAERNDIIIKQIELAINLDEPTLVFSCTKDHVFALMALCRAKSIPAEFIVGETPPAERTRILEAFRSGKLGVLINHEILATGVDLPNVRRLIITRPVGSAILFSQILGRALRGPRNGGQEKNTVISIRDNLSAFGNANLVFQKFANDFIFAT